MKCFILFQRGFLPIISFSLSLQLCGSFYQVIDYDSGVRSTFVTRPLATQLARGGTGRALPFSLFGNGVTDVGSYQGPLLIIWTSAFSAVKWCDFNTCFAALFSGCDEMAECLSKCAFFSKASFLCDLSLPTILPLACATEWRRSVIRASSCKSPLYSMCMSVLATLHRYMYFT